MSKTMRYQYEENIDWPSDKRDWIESEQRYQFQRTIMDKIMHGTTLAVIGPIIVTRLPEMYPPNIRTVRLECHFEFIPSANHILPHATPVAYPVSFRERIKILLTGIVVEKP